MAEGDPDNLYDDLIDDCEEDSNGEHYGSTSTSTLLKDTELEFEDMPDCKVTSNRWPGAVVSESKNATSIVTSSVTFQSLIQDLVARNTAEGEQEMTDPQCHIKTSTPQPPAAAFPDIDLMDDVYSLHTEKEKLHQREVKQLNDRINELEELNSKLAEDKKKLQHNMSLLLVTAKKELASHQNLINTLRKQLIQAGPRPTNQQRIPHSQIQTIADAPISNICDSSRELVQSDRNHEVASIKTAESTNTTCRATINSRLKELAQGSTSEESQLGRNKFSRSKSPKTSSGESLKQHTASKESLDYRSSSKNHRHNNRESASARSHRHKSPDSRRLSRHQSRSPTSKSGVTGPSRHSGVSKHMCSKSSLLKAKEILRHKSSHTGDIGSPAKRLTEITKSPKRHSSGRPPQNLSGTSSAGRNQRQPSIRVVKHSKHKTRGHEQEDDEEMRRLNELLALKKSLLMQLEADDPSDEPYKVSQAQNIAREENASCELTADHERAAGCIVITVTSSETTGSKEAAEVEDTEDKTVTKSVNETTSNSSSSTSEPACSTSEPASSTSEPACSTSEPACSTSEPACSTSEPACSATELVVIVNGNEAVKEAVDPDEKAADPLQTEEHKKLSKSDSHDSQSSDKQHKDKQIKKKKSAPKFPVIIPLEGIDAALDPRKCIKDLGTLKSELELTSWQVYEGNEEKIDTVAPASAAMTASKLQTEPNQSKEQDNPSEAASTKAVTVDTVTSCAALSDHKLAVITDSKSKVASNSTSFQSIHTKTTNIKPDSEQLSKSQHTDSIPSLSTEKDKSNNDRSHIQEQVKSVGVPFRIPKKKRTEQLNETEELAPLGKPDPPLNPHSKEQAKPQKSQKLTEDEKSPSTNSSTLKSKVQNTSKRKESDSKTEQEDDKRRLSSTSQAKSHDTKAKVKGKIDGHSQHEEKTSNSATRSAKEHNKTDKAVKGGKSLCRQASIESYTVGGGPLPFISPIKAYPGILSPSNVPDKAKQPEPLNRQESVTLADLSAADLEDGEVISSEEEEDSKKTNPTSRSDLRMKAEANRKRSSHTTSTSSSRSITSGLSKRKNENERDKSSRDEKRSKRRRI